MHDDVEYIGGLIVKHLKHELNPEETEQLQRWIGESQQNRVKFERLTNTDWLQSSLKKHARYVYEQPALWAAVEDCLASSAGKSRSKILIVRWMKYAAVAAVIMGIYFWIRPGTPVKQQQKDIVQHTEPVQDVLPGKSKAVLILSDGSKIDLDSAKSGRLAKQGNSVVTNNNGQLVYNQQGKKNGEIVFNTLRTEKGQTYSTVLADGSKVWLNSASELRYPVAFNNNERRVEILGEAFFEVYKDESRPFIVSINGVSIRVLGTHFNINAYNDEPAIRTTLLEGSVKISTNTDTKVLKPGEQGATSDQGSVLVSDNINLDQVIAWKDGRFNFDNSGIETVMRQLSRWYSIDVIYQGKKPNIVFMGDLERSLNLSQVLHALGRMGVEFKIEGKKLIVVGK